MVQVGRDNGAAKKVFSSHRALLMLYYLHALLSTIYTYTLSISYIEYYCTVNGTKIVTAVCTYVRSSDRQLPGGRKDLVPSIPGEHSMARMEELHAATGASLSSSLIVLLRREMGYWVKSF